MTVPPAISRPPAATARSTQSSTRAVERSSISADTRVSPFRGSPTTTSPIRTASRLTSSSRTVSVTMTRCTLMHAWPEA